MRERKIKNYKPIPGAVPDCLICDRESRPARGRFQRNKQDFSVQSGRCPRLPDVNGKYDPDWCDLEVY